MVFLQLGLLTNAADKILPRPFRSTNQPPIQSFRHTNRPPPATMATKPPAPTTGEPAVGVPYYPAEVQGQYYYARPNPYTAGMPPPNAIYAGAPKGVPLQQTMFRDTPAPFHCQACGAAAVTSVR